MKIQANRLDWLDALRGWAVLGVVMVHAGQVIPVQSLAKRVSEAGQYGVQLFFIVSALTISMTYESHIARFGTSARSQFAWFTKRFFRIAPLYYLAIFIYPIERYAIYRFSYHRYGEVTHISDVIANMLFIHTWVPSANNSVVPGGWSIGVEMFFYTLVPFCWLLAPLSRRIRILSVAAAGFLLITELVNRLYTGSFFVGDNSYFYFWFPAQAPVLITGMIFYFLCKSKLREQPRSTAAIVWLGGFLALFSIGIYLGTWKEIAPVTAPTILAASFILLILGLRGWVRHVFVGKVVTFLGRISFSVYIFHFIVLDCLRAIMRAAHFDRSEPLMIPLVFVTTVIITSGIALLSKRAIEDPGIAYGHRLSTLIAARSYETAPAVE